MEKKINEKKIIGFDSALALLLLSKTGVFYLAVGGYIEEFREPKVARDYYVHRREGKKEIVEEYTTIAESENYIISQIMLSKKPIIIEEAQLKSSFTRLSIPSDEILTDEDMVRTFGN